MTDETRTFDGGDVATPPQRSGDGSMSGSPGSSGMRVRPEFLPASETWPTGAPMSGSDAFTGPNPYAASGPEGGSPGQGGAYGPGGAGRGDAYGPSGAGRGDAYGFADAYGSGGAGRGDAYGSGGAGRDPFPGEATGPVPSSGENTGFIPFASEGTGPLPYPGEGQRPGGHGERPAGDEGASGWGNPSGGPLPPSPGGPYGPLPPPPPRNAFGMGPGWAPPPPSAPRMATGAAASRVPKTGVLAVLAVVIALVASTVGSVGTYLLTRSGSGVDPSYSLGTPTGAVVNRAPDSVAGVAAKVLPSVVSLDVKGNSEAGTGSGFVIKGGYIVTNNHVVAAAAQTGNIKVMFSNKKSSAGTIVGRDPSSDIAVVKPADTFGAPEITLGDSDRVVVGDPVIAIGSPLGLTGTVTTGIVSSLNRPVTAGGESGSESSFINAIQTDAAINPGNSGGPLVNAAGEVIGVNSAIATLGNTSFGGQSGSIGLGFSIPVNHVRRIAEELVTTGTAKKSRIGVSIDENYQGDGVRIATSSSQGQQPVTPGGPADKAGLKAGDVILEIDGTPVTQPSELIVTIRSKAPGTKVTIKYQRDGSERTTSVTIDAVPVPTPQPS
ncbi:S1C family serine protease [Sphaerisporangium perillae]|uniref:S1C family serine protease n=1 Tax=Sphaerisporangium perillae TaxID=2935860 RepID=UPI00200E5C19|nr:trypsin-like peptidase domain-containing protein [Sphaerisporangium perillae]